MNIIKIRKGFSFEGYLSLIGFFISVGGIWGISSLDSTSSILLYFLFIMIIILGLFLFISIKGLLLDIENNRIKQYQIIFFFKTGKWQSLDLYDGIKLKYIYESQRMNLGLAPSTKVTTHTYNVMLTSKVTESLELKEFTDYLSARDFLDKYSDLLKLKKFDQYENAKIKLAQRRKDLEARRTDS